MLWLEIPAYAGSTISWSSQPPRRRIIPAYAGSTSPAPAGQGPAPDHPRIRGEHESSTSRSRPSPGSSPHTRGAPRDVPPENIDIGIIPAYAGSTRTSPTGSARSRDHPRIRGEHTIDDRRRILTNGSSPHTRGARVRESGEHPAGGIIPAYAGST